MTQLKEEERPQASTRPWKWVPVAEGEELKRWGLTEKELGSEHNSHRCIRAIRVARKPKGEKAYQWHKTVQWPYPAPWRPVSRSSLIPWPTEEPELDSPPPKHTVGEYAQYEAYPEFSPGAGLRYLPKEEPGWKSRPIDAGLTPSVIERWHQELPPTEFLRLVDKEQKAESNPVASIWGIPLISDTCLIKACFVKGKLEATIIQEFVPKDNQEDE